MQSGSTDPTQNWMAGMPKHMAPGMRWRSLVSIVVVFGWLVFILLFAGFWADRFSLFQDIVIFFASIVVAIGIMGVMWAAWGMRWMR